MSKEYKLDILKNNKTYNDTILALWSDCAIYPDYLASAMLIMGYDLRQNFDEMSMMDIGQNSAGTNKVIQLHGRDKSLVLWYTDGDIVPIVVKYEEGNLLFSIYNHENKYLKGYVDGLSTKDLYGASEEVFEKLMELATSQNSPLSDKIEGDCAYTLRNANILQDLLEIMDDPQNMTTDIPQSLKDISELLKNSNKEIDLPSSKSEEVDGVTVGHHIPRMVYGRTKSAYDKYRYFVDIMVRTKNSSYYSDGTRIILSKDLSKVRVYDDKGLYYPVPLLELDSDFEHYDIDYTHGEFLRWLEYSIELAKRANELYSELGDLKGTEFTHAEVLQGKVHLHFKKTNWNTNKVVEGTIYFQLNDPGYTISFKSCVKEVSQKLKLSDEEVLILPSSPLEYTKTLHTNGKDVAQAFHVGLYYVESAKLADLLQTNGLLAQDKKN